MACIVVIGTQWGDEGKGKIVDWLSSKADIVVRFQGGNNAGHTLQIEDKTYKLNLLPSGIIRGKKCIIGNGVVLDPWALDEEIQKLSDQGIKINPDNLMIAENICLILPLHKIIDELNEKNKHIALKLDNHYFICPDNGVISLLASEIKPEKIVEINLTKEEKKDKELKKKLDGIKEVIDTFESFTTGVPLDVPEWEGETADPYKGTTVLSDLQQKENQKALLAQITGYTSPMQRAVDLEKRLTNLVKYT